jgi:transposase
MKRDRAAHRAARKRKRADERSRARQQHNAYIDDEGIDRAAYAGRRVVGIDPNMGNLLYASTEDGAAQFRYTQSQRRAELKIDKHAKIAQELKEGVVEGQSVAAWESQLSAHNFKTVSYDDFCRCVRTKLRVAAKVAPLYRDRWFRKNRLNAYFDRGTSERAMVSGLKRTFGAPDTVVLGIGDWAQKRHRKYKPPTKGKGFRDLLRRAGYPVFLVDEFRTSLQCSKCQEDGGQCKPFKTVSEMTNKERRLCCPPPAPPSRHDDDIAAAARYPFRGLLQCQLCKKVWNRDANAAINMARLAGCALRGG